MNFSFLRVSSFLLDRHARWRRDSGRVQGVVGVTRLDVAREDVCSRLNMAARGTGRIFGDRATPCRVVPGSEWATI
jgi:hypothetical protein